MLTEVEPERLERAVNLIKTEKIGVARAAIITGVPLHALRCHLDPDYRRKRAIATRNRKSARANQMVWKQKYREKPEEKIGRKAIGYQMRVMSVPQDILWERDRRMSLPHRDLTAELFGDPKPGYSALDKKQATMWK